MEMAPELRYTVNPFLVLARPDWRKYLITELEVAFIPE